MMKKWLLIVSLVVNIVLIVAFVVGGTMLRQHLWRTQADVASVQVSLYEEWLSILESDQPDKVKVLQSRLKQFIDIGHKCEVELRKAAQI